MPKHILYLLLTLTSILLLVSSLKNIELSNTIDTNQVTYSNHIKHLTYELDQYRASEQELIDLGASSDQAKAIIRASELYGIDPKH